MSNSGNELLKAFESNNHFSPENVVYIINRIVKTWCLKNKMEITWTVSYIKEQNSNGMVQTIWKDLSDDGIPGKPFTIFKSRIIELAGQLTKEEFSLFIELLKSDNARAWNELVAIFKIRCALWMAERVDDQEYISHIFNDAIMVFHNDLFSGKKLHFADSYALKSYLFRILENKIKEYRRAKKKSRLELYERENIETYFYLDENEDSVNNDQLNLIEHIIERLDGEEQEILRKYYFSGQKLKDIAKVLNITEENVRIKKHRAVKRIIKNLSETSYESFGN
jgi:RNA polymerase sigma-70 factor, ECF subfamily